MRGCREVPHMHSKFESLKCWTAWADHKHAAAAECVVANRLYGVGHLENKLRAPMEGISADALQRVRKLYRREIRAKANSFFVDIRHSAMHCDGLQRAAPREQKAAEPGHRLGYDDRLELRAARESAAAEEYDGFGHVDLLERPAPAESAVVYVRHGGRDRDMLQCRAPVECGVTDGLHAAWDVDAR